MTDRERMIDIVNNSLARNIDKSCNLAKNIVDDLINEGIIQLPCKVGTYVYFITDVNGHCFTIRFGRVYEISIVSNNNLFLSVAEYDKSDNIIDEWNIPKCQWGKTVFLTREEAEKALEE